MNLIYKNNIINKSSLTRLIRCCCLINVEHSYSTTISKPKMIKANCSNSDKFLKKNQFLDSFFDKYSSMNNYENVPLIVIIGATGCGKTKLSIELAKRYGGEIISADSMQIYKGLDIATNKATAEERCQAPHHLLDLVDPFKQFTVLDFQKMTLDSIDKILERQKIPIIVGGTNYYIESILWDTLVGSGGLGDELIDSNEFDLIDKTNVLQEDISDDGDDEEEVDDKQSIDESSIINEQNIETIEDLMKHHHRISYKNLRSISSKTLHRLLESVDPKSASALHIHNKRKIIRCLQVYQQTGKKYSDIIEEQRSKGSRHGGPLRFRNSIILWVDCEKSVLETRLDKRVDQMLEIGLIEELLQFHRDYNNLRLTQNRKADYTEGIFQAIGLKEFHQYLLMSEEERNLYDGSLSMGNGILLLKQRTKSYVTKQLKWIRRRFLVNRDIRQVPNVYRLDTTDVDRWNSEVLQQAASLIDHSFEAMFGDHTRSKTIWNEILNPASIKIAISSQEDSFVSGQFYCDCCQVWISGGNSYREHRKSKKHQHFAKLHRTEQSTTEEAKLN